MLAPTSPKTIKKILLISPPGKITVTTEGSRERKLAVPPLGLAYLAAQLMHDGYEVKILDVLIEGYENEVTDGPTITYGLSDDDVKQVIADYSPDLVGVSCLFSNRGKDSVNICNLSKQVFPDVPVVYGGQHPSGLPELVKHDSVDYIIYGEAETAFTNLVECLNDNGDLKQVPQLVMQEGDSYWKSPVQLYPDVHKIPFPAWDLVNLEKYWSAGLAEYEVNEGGLHKFMVMIASRGCPHVCEFCTSPLMTNRNFRRRNIEDIIEEIKLYRDKYGVREIHFWDDNFFVSKPWVKRLLGALVQELPDIAFQVPSGAEVNAIDDEMIDLISQAGFKKLFLAIESANQDVQLERVDKKVKLDRVSSVIEKVKNRGIITEGSFMVGFPGESKAQIDHTFQRATELNLDRISISIVNPLPGTPLYDECLEKDLLYDDFDCENIRWSNENIRLPDTERGYLAKRRREVWENYMKNRINIEEYERQNITTEL